MQLVALGLSVSIAVLSALYFVAPARLLNVTRWFQTPVGLYAASALRLLLGVALFLVAPSSRAPRVLRILGILIFVAGLVTPFIGVDRSRKLLDWWSARGPGFNRVWAAVSFAFGLFLVYAIAR